jgi:hypothetical protein
MLSGCSIMVVERRLYLTSTKPLGLSYRQPVAMFSRTISAKIRSASSLAISVRMPG